MSTRALISWTLAVALTAGSAVLSADRVKLRKDGRVIEGSFVSADAKRVRLLLANGSMAEFPIEDITGVEFSARKTPPPPAPDPARAPAPVTVPAGTLLNVRLVEAIDVDATKTGATFKSLLDDPVMLKGVVVIPRGSIVLLQAAKVEQAGKMKGADKITLKANSIAFGGNKYEIVTTQVESKGGGEGKKTTRKVAGGAGTRRGHRRHRRRRRGCGYRRAVGGAAGAVVASQGTEHLQLPAETRLQFNLSAAVTVRP